MLEFHTGNCSFSWTREKNKHECAVHIVMHCVDQKVKIKIYMIVYLW